MNRTLITLVLVAVLVSFANSKIKKA